MSLYREDMDKMSCGNPECKHKDGAHNEKLFLYGRCHLRDPTWSYYQNGVVTVVCATCDQVIASFHVAMKPTGVTH